MIGQRESNNMEYTVQFYMNGEYRVINEQDDSTEFRGSISDCEAWIRLHEGGYM